MVGASDFGFATDPRQQAEEDVRPYRQLSPQQRYASAQAKLDDPGRWWERVPRDDADA